MMVFYDIAVVHVNRIFSYCTVSLPVYENYSRMWGMH